MRSRSPKTRGSFAVLAAVPALLCALSALGVSTASTAQAQANSVEDSATSALCPVIYPDDQSPASRGYRYTFFGNAFFINEQGYLLTVAHVLETFRDGGQPYILVRRPDAPPKLLRVNVIAEDLQHDVAVLRATPNPFAGKYSVAYLPLASVPAVRGESVLALSLHPKRLQSAYSFEFEREDSSPGKVLSYESTQLDNSGPVADVFLLSHPVVKGQSGSPVMADDSHAVVGLVEGLWLRGISLPAARSANLPTDSPGAAIPIRYATALLQQHAIAWHSAQDSPAERSSTHTTQSSSKAARVAAPRAKQ
ncbi:MAG: serine protease [Candidatus Acidiferrum sp.]